MKKKITIAITTIAMITTLAACGDNTTESGGSVIEFTTEVTTEMNAEADNEEVTTATEKTTESESTEASKPEGTTQASKPETTEASKPKSTEAPKSEKTTESTEAPAPSATTEEVTQPTTPETTEVPAHEHSWIWVVDKEAWTETVVVKEAYEVWVVDQAAWTETIEHAEEGYWQPTIICNYCYENFTSADAFKAHALYYQEIDRDHSYAGHGTGDTIWVKTKDAWTETVEHEEVGHWEEVPAETKTVKHEEVGHWECSCGATK